MDFSFAVRDNELRNTTKAWLTSHLIGHLLKPSARLADHLCMQRRAIGFGFTGAGGELRCRLPQKVLGVQLHLYAGSSSLKHYVNTAVRLLTYTGARHLLLVPTNAEGLNSDDSCVAATAAVQAAIRRQALRNDSARNAFLPANLGSVKIGCLSRAAGVLAAPKRATATAAPAAWASSLYYLSAVSLLAESDYFLGMMETDLARI
eukprot:2991565-Prymnesium_polylepis.1